MAAYLSGSDAVKAIKAPGAVYGRVVGKDDLTEIQLVKADLLFRISDWESNGEDFWANHVLILWEDGHRVIDSAT